MPVAVMVSGSLAAASVVSSWVARLSKEVTDVVLSARNLKNLLDKAGHLFDDVGEKFAGLAAMALGYGSKNADNAAKSADNAVDATADGAKGADGALPSPSAQSAPAEARAKSTDDSAAAGGKGTSDPASSPKSTPNKNGGSPPPKGEFPDVQSLQGRAADDVLDAIPDDWIVDTPRKEPYGIRFRNPHRNGEQIMYEPGKHLAKDPLRRGPYLRISEGGRVRRIPLEGNPAL